MLISCDERKKVIYITPGGDLVAEEAEAMHGQLQEYMRHDMETLVLDHLTLLASIQSSFSTI
jgi:hypothetical protein